MCCVTPYIYMGPLWHTVIVLQIYSGQTFRNLSKYLLKQIILAWYTALLNVIGVAVRCFTVKVCISVTVL